LLDEAHDRFEHRGLSGAVRPEERDRLAFADLETDVSNDIETSVARG
jgi:hypothetical protein